MLADFVGRMLGGETEAQQQLPLQQFQQQQHQWPQVLKDDKLTGCVKSYNAGKSYGFITSAGVTQDVYFQRRDVPVSMQENPEQVVGSTVRFRVKTAPDGKPQAFGVEFTSNKRTQDAVGGMAVPQMAKRLHISQDQGGRMSGCVKSYSSANGWGLIASEQVDGDVDFQGMDLPEAIHGHEDLVQGWLVTFDIDMTAHGMPQARNIEFPDGASLARMQPQVFGGAKGPCTKGAVLGGAKGPGKGKFDCMAGLKGDGMFGFKGGCKGDGGGFKGGAGKGGKQKGPGLQGVIKSYNHAKGFGFIICVDTPGDIYFQRRDVPVELQEQPEMVAGRNVTFHLTHAADGKPQAFNVVFDGQAAACTAALALMPASPDDSSLDNAQFTGLINAYDASNGIGSIASEEIPAAVCFQRTDLPPPMQWDQSNVIGKQVEFGIKLSSDGNPWAVSMKIRLSATSPVPGLAFMDPQAIAEHLRSSAMQPGGDLMSGIVKSYSTPSGFGFIASAGVAGDVYFQRRDVPLEIQHDVSQIVGRCVVFQLNVAPDGKPQARKVTFQMEEGL